MQSCYQVNPKYILHFTNTHDAKQKLFKNHLLILSALCLCATALLIFLHSIIAILMIPA
jgi:hypothetical protein